MDDIIVGTEALAAGFVTRQMLRTKYVKLHYNVYAPVGMQLDAADRARAAWLWSRRQGPRTTSADACQTTGQSFESTRCSTPPDAPSRTSAESPTGTRARAASRLCAPHWTSPTAARNRPRRPSFGCYSCAIDCRGQRLKSRSASAVSTWGGRSGRSASSTTVNNIGLIQTNMPTTSSGSSSLRLKAGSSYGSAHDSCDSSQGS